jgi:hypothetical protein
VSRHPLLFAFLRFRPLLAFYHVLNGDHGSHFTLWKLHHEPTTTKTSNGELGSRRVMITFEEPDRIFIDGLVGVETIVLLLLLLLLSQSRSAGRQHTVRLSLCNDDHERLCSRCDRSFCCRGCFFLERRSVLLRMPYIIDDPFSRRRRPRPRGGMLPPRQRRPPPRGPPP